MLDLIYDRTAEDLYNRRTLLEGNPRTNTSTSVMLFDNGAGESPRGAFFAEAGKTYSFEVYRHIPQTVYIYHVGTGGGLEVADEYSAVGGVSQFDYKPDEDEYIRIELADLSGVSSASDAAETEFYRINNRGFYRYTDLNRVQAAVAYLRGICHEYGYDLAKTYVLPTWAENDVPRKNTAEDYLNAVKTLDGWFPIPGKPELPYSMDRLDYVGANNIEKFLAMLEDSLERIAAAWFYSDEVYSGEVDA